MRFALGFLIATSATFVHAGVIFSNLGPGGSFGTSGWVVGTSVSPFGSTSLEVAAAFTPLSDAVFTGADFAVQSLGGFNGLTVTLMTTGPSGTPDAALETFQLQSPSVPSLVSVQSASNPFLSAGTEYWLDMRAPLSRAEWFDNSSGARGPVAVNQNQNGFVLLTGFGGTQLVQPAFQIDGDPVGFSFAFAAVAAPVSNPEPPSLLLVIGGVLVLYAKRNRVYRELHQFTHRAGSQ